MPDRLAELRRQRALIQEHLAWLDKQIAEAEGKTPEASRPTVPLPGANPPSPAPEATAAAVVAAALKASASANATPSEADAPEVAAAADAILEDYRSDPVSLKADVRKGCFLYFFAALALIALGVAALWFIFRM